MFDFLKSDPKKRLDKEYKTLLEQAMRSQRNGDIRKYSELTELAEAKRFFFILPAKKEFLPEITASLKAFAIKIGFFAFAIALLIKTPSHPNSIAIVASEAVPIPASTITGTLLCFTIKEILILF